MRVSQAAQQQLGVPKIQYTGCSFEVIVRVCICSISGRLQLFPILEPHLQSRRRPHTNTPRRGQKEFAAARDAGARKCASSSPCASEASRRRLTRERRAFWLTSRGRHHVLRGISEDACRQRTQPRDDNLITRRENNLQAFYLKPLFLLGTLFNRPS